MSDNQTLYLVYVESSRRGLMATVALVSSSVKVFPKVDVVKALTEELLKVAKSEAEFRGIIIPSSESEAIKAPVPMDSLTVVDALCVLDPIVGFKPKESIVQMGGYDSVEDALHNMIPKLERAWNRKRGARK